MLKAGLPPALAPNIDELIVHIEFLEASLLSAQAQTDGESYTLVVECSAEAVRADGDGVEETLDYSGPLELEVLFEEGATPVLLEAKVDAGQARFEHVFEQRPTLVRLDPRVLHIDRDLADNELTVQEILQ